MRLSDDKIRAGLLHEKRFVRDASLGYFSSSMSEDRQAMRIACQAIDQYGWGSAFSDLEMLQGLVQSDESFDWMLAEFVRIQAPKTLAESEYLSHLSGILAFADPDLLKRRRKDWSELRFLSTAAVELVRERTLMLTMSDSECWRQLETFCRSATQSPHEVEGLPDRVFGLIETISRSARDPSGRVYELLTERVPDSDLPRTWLQALMVTLAGQLRMSPAIPILVERMEGSTPAWLLEESAIALTRISGDEVVKALWNRCALADAEFRQVASWVLQGIHTDLALEALLQLLRDEQDVFAVYDQAQALLSQFAVDGIAPVRQLLLSGRLEPDQSVAIRFGLLAVCTLLDAQLPELDAWCQEYQQEEDRRASYTTPEVQVEGWLPPATQAARGTAEAPAHAPPLGPDAITPTRVVRPLDRNIGRNDPCPCQSGRKFKHCCLRK